MTWEPMPVDTKHSLEMQTKMYEYPPHITVIQEVIANARDAFEESKTKNGVVNISFVKDSDHGYIIFNNNAGSISKEFFEKDYQTLFKSSKTIGSGIGFVGIGAKIFLASPDGGEITTVTGTKNDILAAKWRWSEQGPQYTTSLKQHISSIVDLSKFPHESGTTFICKLSMDKYSELNQNIESIIQFWWNYGLLNNNFEIKLSGQKITPWIPAGVKKHETKFTFLGQEIKCIFWISDVELIDDFQNIIYVVHDKRITHEKLDSSQIKDGFAAKICCYANAPALGKYVTTSKERFDKDKMATQIKNRIKSAFWDFIDEQNLRNKITKDITKNVELETLLEKLNKKLQSSDFKDCNPFLSKRERKIPVLDDNGDENIGESDGFQNTGEGSSNDNVDGTIGDNSGRGNIFDEKSKKTGSTKIRHARGINIGEIEHDPSEKREAYVSIADKAVIINTGHLFYKKVQNSTISEFNKYRIVVDAVVRYQTDVENWSIETALNKSRDLLHSIWD